MSVRQSRSNGWTDTNQIFSTDIMKYAKSPIFCSVIKVKCIIIKIGSFKSSVIGCPGGMSKF